jgi:hypothetical protein
MSYLGSVEDAKKEINKIEPHNETSGGSPALSGGSGPGPTGNKLAGEVMRHKRTPLKEAHKGEGVTRKIE